MNLDQRITDLRQGTPLSEKDTYLICEAGKELLVEESNIQPVSAPVTVCGNFQGCLYDLLELFKTGGEIPDTLYVFLGDYVNYQYQSVETFQLLVCYKVKYPAHITLLRGHHECQQITQLYGFYDEVVRKDGNANIWKYCIEGFEYLCIGALIEERVFCLLGGLSPETNSLDTVRTIDRKVDISHEGVSIDPLWSDPNEDDSICLASSPRGAGWLFGRQVVKEFNHLNGLELIAIT